VASWPASNGWASRETSLISQLGLAISMAGLASSPVGMPASLPICWSRQRNNVGHANVGAANDPVSPGTGSAPRRQAMSTYPTFSPRVIGQAEKTLNAILGRQLAGTGLTEAQWVILTLAVTSGGTTGHEAFTHTVAGALKISETEARALISDLVTAQQLQITGEPPAVTVTGPARQ